METPDWLSKLKPEQSGEKAPALEDDQAPSDDLEAGALPSWVQAMRPVESVVSEAGAGSLQEDQVTEQSGPLAGLVGVLPSSPGLGALRKPPTYSIKLHLSDTQQRYITYFDRLIAEETHSRAAKAARPGTNRVWRWIISLFLILAISLPIFTRVRVASPLGLSSSDTIYGNAFGASAKVISDLPANAPVLLTFDYEAALSAELEAAAAPLVDQLMAKGARLVVVSTSPTGPALAERFLLSTPLVNSHQYSSGEEYYNLGYIAGGMSAISYFSGDPAGVMPIALNGSRVWDDPALKGVTELSNFAAIFILTDNADTGRNWVEQTRPYIGTTPMVMVVSSQAEPMIRPYFASGQLQGLVSGLLDAKIYEQNYSRPGLANLYWSSYSLGTLMAGILIVVGAAWNLFKAWQMRRKSTGDEA